MGERTSHAPGTLSWTDLVTSDLEGAKAFYTALFGWEYEDMPVGDGAVYTMARVDGLDVGAMSEASDQPSHWNLYVTVASADDAAVRAAALGGTVLAEPFDVFDAGRMTVVQDPTGATLCPWEPRRNVGARLVNAPGALTWADLATPDPDAATRFYGEWLGWSFEAGEFGPDYPIIHNGARINGGVTRLEPAMAETAPAHWYPYLGTAGLGPALEQVATHGGRTVMPATETPVGSFAIVADPQGATLALWEGRYDD